MKILQCMFCKGELEIIQDKGIVKKIKCSSCNFTNSSTPKEPEVVVIRKRTT